MPTSSEPSGTVLQNEAGTRPLLTTRQIVHMSMLAFAFLLPFLTWAQAAGAALLALGFNLFILPRLDADFGKPTVAPHGARARSAWLANDNQWTGIVLYPVSVLVLILLYRHAMQVVGAVWAIMALGDASASVVGSRLHGPRLPYHERKTWSGSVAFVVAGSAGAYVLARWVSPSLPPDKALMVCVATAVVGAVVESLPIRLDDNLSLPLVAGAFMYCAFLVERPALDSNLPYLGRRVLAAVGVNLVFALAAFGMKSITRLGAAVGFLLGVVIYLAWGWKSFLLLLVFFALGSGVTRAGYARKSARGVAEHRGGKRGWPEALGNGLAPAFFAALVLLTHRESAALLALVASLAEAAGDTVSSEIGQWLSGRAYLITTLRPVPAGENGGVSAPGSIAGALALGLMVALGAALGLCRGGWHGVALAAGAAAAGNVLDSLLGATIEREGLVTNSIVNFAGTAFAGALAFALSR